MRTGRQIPFPEHSLGHPSPCLHVPYPVPFLGTTYVRVGKKKSEWLRYCEEEKRREERVRESQRVKGMKKEIREEGKKGGSKEGRKKGRKNTSRRHGDRERNRA